MGRIERLGAWPARAAWLVLALAAGGPFGAALEGRSTPVTAVVASALWCGWLVGAVALLVPRSASLTAIRVLVPAGLAAAVTALVVVVRDGGTDEMSALDVVALAAAVVAVLGVLAPWVSEAFVDGSAYGPEQRTPLRTSPVLLAVAVLTWLAVVAGAAAGPLLLATGRSVVGALTLLVGWAVVVAGLRSLHQLARRWVVLVPAGLVVHDPLTMPEPQLFLRPTILRVGAAPAEPPSEATTVTEDLTAGAAGLALELVLSDPVDLLVRTGGGSNETRSVDRVLFTPTRPLTVLDAARQRRIPVR